MIKTCQKCGHMNPDATGDEMEACPECGAIYSRVAAAMAAKAEKLQGSTAAASANPQGFAPVDAAAPAASRSAYARSNSSR